MPWHLSGLVHPPGKSSIFSACMGLNLIACNGIISVVSIPLIVTVASGNWSGFWKRRHNYSSPLNHCLSPFQRNSNSLTGSTCSYQLFAACNWQMHNPSLTCRPIFHQTLNKKNFSVLRTIKVNLSRRNDPCFYSRVSTVIISNQKYHSTFLHLCWLKI